VFLETVFNLKKLLKKKEKKDLREFLQIDSIMRK